MRCPFFRLVRKSYGRAVSTGPRQAWAHRLPLAPSWNPPVGQCEWLVALRVWPRVAGSDSTGPRLPDARWNEPSYFRYVYAPGDHYQMVVQSIVSEVAKPTGVDRTLLEHD